MQPKKVENEGYKRVKITMRYCVGLMCKKVYGIILVVYWKWW